MNVTQMAESYKDLEGRMKYNFTRRKLHVEKYSQEVSVTSFTFDDVDVFYDNVINVIRNRFTKKLLVDQLPGKVFQHPLDWWEHFKQRWFPQWLLNKYPIKYQTIEINFLVKYPHYKLNNETLGRGYLEIIETTT